MPLGRGLRIDAGGRQGWRTWWLRQGFALYVVDVARRGRSGFDPSPFVEVRRGSRPPASLPAVTTLTAEALWPMFRFGPRFEEAWPGLQFPVDCLEHYLAQILPDFDLPQLDNPHMTATIGALLDRIGGAIVVSHSASGPLGWAVSERWPEAVRAHVAVEGPGAPVDAMGAAVAHDGPRADEAEATPQALIDVPSLAVFGDYIETDELWPVFKASCEHFAARVTDGGGIASVLDLPAVGVRGNTHMMMCDLNSDEVSERILDWVEHHRDRIDSGRPRRASAYQT